MLSPREWLLFAVLFTVPVGLTLSVVSPAVAQTKSKKKRTKKKKKKAPEAAPPVEAAPPPAAPPEPDLEALRQELEAAKAEAEKRKTSKVTPGTASRWSNRGAMVPVQSELQLTAPLPQRAVPVPMGVETPGQSLIGEEGTLSARLALSYYHIQTRGQDIVYSGEDVLEGVDRDIDFMRGRATMAYERIAGTEFGAHLDLEYRPRINGTRFTDSRLNELYVSYGLTDFRRPGGPWWGLAAGRLSIREAGYAQADGVAFRARPIEALQVGAFAGLTGNPYGYNWRQRTTQLFSADWWTGGAFASLRTKQLTVNASGVLTFANLLVERVDDPAVTDGPGIDRVYAYLDAAYLVTRDFNVLVTGWLDILPGGQTVQNAEVIGSYTPLPGLDLTLGLGRFSTVVYELSTGYSYTFDPNGNLFQPNLPPIVDENNNPIVPFDGALFTTIYNQIRFRAGYRVMRDLEVFARVNSLIRDFSGTNDIAQAQFGATINQASLRVVPGGGVRYRNPSIVDASAEASYIADDVSNADAMTRFMIGRGLYGFYVSADARNYFGKIKALDAGVDLTYTLPRDLFPGQLMVRGSFRYYEEAVAVRRPDLGTDQLDDGDVQFIIPKQESYMGFLGMEWRM
ncbi:MAG: hypothetical protein KC933_07660 [Myxococcales bacterium]|nr:hypothetical protein [Myxococcales bacterium]